MSSRRDTYDPFKDPYIHLRPEPAEVGESETASLEPVERRPLRRRQRLDWGAVANRLALGKPVDTVAREFGCPVNRIWRNMKRSRRFRARIEQELNRVKLQTSLQFRSLAGHAVRQLECRTEKLDAKTLLWLAERLRLGGRPLKADGLAHWFAEVATLRLEETPPKPEPDGPTVIGSKEEFMEELRLAEAIGSDKLIQDVIRTEQTRLDANQQLRKSYQIAQEIAEARVDV